MGDEKQKHLIVITHGVEDGIRQILFAFQFSITLKNMGIDVEVFLTGLAAKWAYRGIDQMVQGENFIVLRDYIKEFLNSGGAIMVCRTCYGEEYNLKEREEMNNSLTEGVKMVGLSVIAEKSLDSKLVVF